MSKIYDRYMKAVVKELGNIKHLMEEDFRTQKEYKAWKSRYEEKIEYISSILSKDSDGWAKFILAYLREFPSSHRVLTVDQFCGLVYFGSILASGPLLDDKNKRDVSVAIAVGRAVEAISLNDLSGSAVSAAFMGLTRFLWGTTISKNGTQQHVLGAMKRNEFWMRDKMFCSDPYYHWFGLAYRRPYGFGCRGG